ncbi:unnamed protein product [Eruca vesicaria subsp. sativa]|uniref:Secreted protein n=1 Tax=Eruca vesicaria subsp. sativa TaxID=29727 RepID=A0ABC8LWQ0_ERUVS|nr:unnamed protein product [Eruca vesicaria subsp. sativa]
MRARKRLRNCMRGARWRILATPLLPFFVSGSFDFICFPLYPSENLKSASLSSSPISLRSFRLFSHIFALFRARQISSVFSRFSSIPDRIQELANW